MPWLWLSQPQCEKRWDTHAPPEIRLIMTLSPLQTCLMHPDSILLVRVLITWKPLIPAEASYRQVKDTRRNHEDGFGLQLI